MRDKPPQARFGSQPCACRTATSAPLDGQQALEVGAVVARGRLDVLLHARGQQLQPPVPPLKLRNT